MYDVLNTDFCTNLWYLTYIRTSRFPVKGFTKFLFFLGANSLCFWRDLLMLDKYGTLWRYILSFCTYCRRRQYVPTLTAHIVVHRHMSPATICAVTTLLSLLHNGRRNVQSCIGTICRRRHYVPWPCAHFVAAILSWQIISWQKIDVKRERKIDTHTHARTRARAHTHTHTGRLTDWQTDRRLDKVHVR